MEKSECDIIIDEWEGIVRRNLVFQRYVFRRAWGIFYSIAAAMIAAINLLSIAGVVGLAGLTIALLSTLVLITITVMLFRRAERTVKLKRTIRTDHRRMGPWRGIGLWILVLYSLVIASAIFLPAYTILILYAALIPTPFIIWYGLKFSFLGELPIEGILAVVSYGSSVVLSLILSIVGAILGTTFSTSLLWFAAVLVWFLASFYALRHAPDELEVLVEE